MENISWQKQFLIPSLNVSLLKEFANAHINNKAIDKPFLTKVTKGNDVDNFLARA